MILLDMNVLSELLRRAPSVQVLRWLRAQPGARLYISSVSHAELWCGVELLPQGRRRQELSAGISALLRELFQSRILSFTEAESIAYAQIFSQRQAMGRPIDTMDAQIAAIARVHGASLATRNTRDFEHCGLTLINPWED